MKNTIKIIGIIALVGIIGFSMVSCGSLESGLEGTWKRDGDTLVIAKDNLSYNIGGLGEIKLADKVKTKGDKIVLELSKVDAGEATYTLSGNKLTLSRGTLLLATANGEWTK